MPVGELEGFCKSEGGHGPRWVQQVIEKYDLAKDDKLAPARDFIRNVWNGRNPTAQQSTEPAVGHNRKSVTATRMSAFGGKAEVDFGRLDVGL